jgi:hypothetical protein
MESSCRPEKLTDSIAYFLLAAMRVAWKAKLHPIANETKITPNKVPFIEQNESSQFSLTLFLLYVLPFLLYVLCNVKLCVQLYQQGLHQQNLKGL